MIRSSSSSTTAADVVVEIVQHKELDDEDLHNGKKSTRRSC